MCLAVPARIIELEGDRAVVDAMGNRWKAKTTLLPEAKLGDVVLVHAGFAISTVDEEEAKKTWELFAEIEDVARAWVPNRDESRLGSLSSPRFEGGTPSTPRGQDGHATNIDKISG
jgi:hydrogenase expression/formation protein HypC